MLPFSNFGNDPEQQYFADGITEDLTTDLSRIPDMFVISRNTAFTYQGKRVDTKQVGRELGVRYVLEGSVRRAGNQVRVNAQLIDTETDAHLWAERFDRDTGDLFAVQDEITSRIEEVTAPDPEPSKVQASSPVSVATVLTSGMLGWSLSLNPLGAVRHEPVLVALYSPNRSASPVKASTGDAAKRPRDRAATASSIVARRFIERSPK